MGERSYIRTLCHHRLVLLEQVVIFRDGTYLTLKEAFERLDLTRYDLNVDLLDVHADKSIFHRFDKFNLKYSPCGQSRLSEIFLCKKTLSGTRNATGLVPLAIVAGLDALTHTLGTLVPMIRASGFAIGAVATAIGTVVGSFR
ncbi:unnamed protein product [Camellia sinensis]|uniref:AMP deaminase-like isoform X1 n=1 Tax=Camellia sinensis TaxID=4442 RepID=UPI001036BF05|nr:AMP deaminase-like isoform X1 [Camellia sinensis]XP_028116189.1 AMP deaminase-like isoform X1 [Camellia sinensis]XP_028116191.1 AMP deaminase-like isoform X1 [Camellia sinensis]